MSEHKGSCRDIRNGGEETEEGGATRFRVDVYGSRG